MVKSNKFLKIGGEDDRSAADGLLGFLLDLMTAFRHTIFQKLIFSSGLILEPKPFMLEIVQNYQKSCFY
jgi:hypothetical protein